MLRSHRFACILALSLALACSDSADPPASDPSVSAFPNTVNPGSPANLDQGTTDSMGATGPGAGAAGSSSGASGSSEGPPPVAGVEPGGPAAGGMSPGAGAENPAGNEMPTGTEMIPGSEMAPAAGQPGEVNDPTPVTPSAGCGNPNPATGQLSLTVRGAQADYLVTTPDNYSPDTPLPLVFGFHGRNRTFLQFVQVDAGGIEQQFRSRAIMVYMQSQGGAGWNNAQEVPPSVEFWEQLYPQMLANYCVDTSRVFAVGHSSGGIFSNILACRHGDLLRGVGVVAGDQQETNCTGEVASILIHGPQDTVVNFSRGLAARQFAVARSSCTEQTVPAAVAPCVAYQGCEPGLPVTWCEHNEPTYLEMGQPTNHGWPSFASAAIADFLFSLP